MNGPYNMQGDACTARAQPDSTPTAGLDADAAGGRLPTQTLSLFQALVASTPQSSKSAAVPHSFGGVALFVVCCRTDAPPPSSALFISNRNQRHTGCRT